MGSTFVSLMPMVILFLLIPHSMGDTQALINNICRQTDDFKFCRYVFSKHVNPNTNPIGLTRIALSVTLQYASSTLTFLQRSQAAEKDKNVKNLFTICEEGYQELINEFKDANSALARSDYSSAVFDVEKCDRFVNDCESVLGSTVAKLSVKNSHAGVLVKMAFVSSGLLGQ
ncbi:hypothetical protein BUALT_Bualt07G0104900 [Buddleja alternifolia]|uniref:Pectinesterase inhibitor domain-containing protein n=1 Tax=Buddleja alternifolia TaxID=168488 RepID=A0AAV6XHU3_9LAMI|nr:hypothetical protein BUALT_Bualt07G0104900 [Buddleja alternifolia]